MDGPVVCHIRITEQTKAAYAHCFKLIFDQCKKENPDLHIGKTLLGIIIDWSEESV